MIHALTFAAYAVTLDGKTVLPRTRAAVAQGHVLLPVRALGDALGADVGYDGRTQTITVQRGAHVATIPSRGAVRIVSGRAYAPLRAVAAAFGLGVGYDARSRTVALDDRAAGPVARNVPHATSAPAPAYAISEAPPDGASIHEPYPSISVRFAGAASIDPRSVSVLLDGYDVSANAAVIGDRVSITPRSALLPGRHDVRVTARDTRNGAVVDHAWSFDDSFAFAAAPPSTPYPVAGIWIDRYVTPGTNAFDVYVQGAPGMTGYVGVDGVGHTFPLRVYTASEYVAHVVIPNGVNQPNARVAARMTFPDGRQETIELPQRIALVTQPVQPPAAVPTPSYTTAPVPSPRPTRRSVDVPAASPAPRTSPTRVPAIHTPVPAATPSASPVPSAAPSPVRTRRPLIHRPTPKPTPE